MNHHRTIAGGRQGSSCGPGPIRCGEGGEEQPLAREAPVWPVEGLSEIRGMVDTRGRAVLDSTNGPGLFRGYWLARAGQRRGDEDRRWEAVRCGSVTS